MKELELSNLEIADICRELALLLHAGISLGDGLALLAAYMAKKDGQTLENYLNSQVFAQAESITLMPEQADVDGFNAYIAAYRKLLQVEKTAVEVL